jgi:hypothetical protein
MIHLKNTSRLNFTSLGDLNSRKSREFNSKLFAELMAK